MKTTMYGPEDYLILSGIQHFVFCNRQWALIHIGQQWADNRLTAEGELMHGNVDNPAYRQKNGSIITLRRVSVASSRLGLYGLTDAVELQPAQSAENAITHQSYPGWWYPHPIEYKHGTPKPDLRDKVQVAAQAMCLEEMHNIVIHEGSLYYGESHGRITFEIDNELRLFTAECAADMHRIFDTGIIPQALYKPHCRNCSLLDECMPKTPTTADAIQTYLTDILYA